MKCQLSRLTRTLKATMFHRLFPFVILRRKLNEITGEFLNRLEFELKSTGEVKDKLAKEKDELTRDSKRLKHVLKNPTFDISKFKEKDEDIEFYTGLLHWNALMLLNDMLHDKAQNLNYGSYAKKNSCPEQNLGRPKSMTIFEEFILTLMRLRLG